MHILPTTQEVIDISEELIGAGALYEDVPVMRDRNLVISPVPDDLPAFLAAIEEALLDPSI